LPPQVSQIQHALDSRTGADDSLKVAALDFIARPGCHGATARLHSLLPNRSWFTPSHSDGISGWYLFQVEVISSPSKRYQIQLKPVIPLAITNSVACGCLRLRNSGNEASADLNFTQTN